MSSPERRLHRSAVDQHGVDTTSNPVSTVVVVGAQLFVLFNEVGKRLLDNNKGTGRSDYTLEEINDYLDNPPNSQSTEEELEGIMEYAVDIMPEIFQLAGTMIAAGFAANVGMVFVRSIMSGLGWNVNLVNLGHSRIHQPSRLNV